MDTTGVPWVALLAALLFLLGSGQLIVMIRRYQRIERGRVAAALGDRRLLADRQPQPRLDALPLPTVISLRSLHPPRTILWIGCLIVTGVLFLNLDRMLPAFSERSLSLWPWFLLLALVCGVQLALVLPSMGARMCWLEVTPTTIRSHRTSIQAQAPTW